MFSTLDDPRMNGKPGKQVLTREDGWTWFDSEKHDKGSFHGRVGTMRMNSKRQSRRMPNGSRKYHPWNPAEVIAYKP